MFPVALSLLISLLPSSHAAGPSVRQAIAGPDFRDRDVPEDLVWETVSVPRLGQEPVQYELACSPVYGVGLEARDCFNTMSFTPRGTEQEPWVVDRRAPPGTEHAVRLPVIILNSETNCALSPRLVPTMNLAHASWFNVSEAARAVIIRCVIPRRIGGAAVSIGGDNKLAVDVRDLRGFNPQCGEPIRATERSCQYIMDEMLKDTAKEVFGRPPVSTVSVALPITLRSPDGLCQVVIDDHQRPAVYSTWANVWFAIELVTARCVRAGKGGSQAVRGIEQSLSTLRVTIMDEPAQLMLLGQEGNKTEE